MIRRVSSAGCVALALLTGCGGRESTSGGRAPGVLHGGAGGARDSTAADRASPSTGAGGATGNSKGGDGGVAGRGTELPPSGSIQRQGNSGGAASNLDAGADGTTPDGGGIHGPFLRDTPPGSAVSFDPDAVYGLGFVSDASGGPYGIAPLAALDDSVLGIPQFSTPYVRPTDGHLLYSFVRDPSGGHGVITALYDFHRDADPLSDLTAGEPLSLDGPTVCADAPRGASGIPNTASRYFMDASGAVYHSCILDDALPDGAEVFYGLGPSPVTWTDPQPYAISATGRAVTKIDGGRTVLVFDIATGARYESRSVTNLFGGDDGTAFTLAVRTRADGFRVAGGWHGDPMGGGDPMATAQYADLDSTGNVVERGYYAPLPSSVVVDFASANGSWVVKGALIDGSGALYQFAAIGSDGVVVRRPTAGPSTVVYRQSEWTGPRPHTVVLDYIVSGASVSF